MTTNESIAVQPKVKSAKEIRDEYRTALVGNTPEAEAMVVDCFGYTIELKQPPLSTILGKTIEGDIKEKMAFFIINYAFIPNTDVLIFEEADKPQILKWPFGRKYMIVQNAINTLMGVDIAEEEEDLKADPLDEQS